MTLKDVPYINEKSMENALDKNGIYFSIYYNAQLGLIDKVHAIKCNQPYPELITLKRYKISNKFRTKYLYWRIKKLKSILFSMKFAVVGLNQWLLEDIHTLLLTKLAIEKLCYYQNKKLNTLMRSITKTITRVSCINKLTTNYFLA